MKIHRFYVGQTIELKHDFWLHDERLMHQWNKVLRLRQGEQVALFDGTSTDRLYTIAELKDNEAHVQLVTDYERQLPAREVYLLWALLKKDKNDWVLQKATELGVSHFLPLITDRTEKMGFDVERADKIVIEAAEQCGRSDIPTVREPMHVATAIKQLREAVQLCICEQSADNNQLIDSSAAVGVLIGPEGGWSDAEKQLFQDNQLTHIAINSFTLRAETAAITAVSQLLQ